LKARNGREQVIAIALIRKTDIVTEIHITADTQHFEHCGQKLTHGRILLHNRAIRGHPGSVNNSLKRLCMRPETRDITPFGI
jgi:hypothetical protein